MPTTPVIIIIAILIGIILFITISLFKTLKRLKNIEAVQFLNVLHKYDEVITQEKDKNRIIGNIVEAVKENTIKKENQKESSQVSLENIAAKIKDHNAVVRTNEEEDEFWVWVDKEVAKMTDEEREELSKLINK